MRKMIVKGAALAVAAGMWASAAVAAPVVFSGGGLFLRSFGSLAPTGTAAVGDGFRFSFIFDLDEATPTFSGSGVAAFTLPVTDFSAMLGRYEFVPAGTTAGLTIGQGFSFFGQPFSEPSRRFTLSFRGTAGADAPFDLGSGLRADGFSVTAIYRDVDPSRPLSPADVIDPAGNLLNSASYAGSTGVPGATSASVAGPYDGTFTEVAGAVPEPATWAMMVVGFGVIGAGMRRRGKARLASI